MKKGVLVFCIFLFQVSVYADESQKKVIIYNFSNSAFVDSSYRTVLPQTLVHQLAKDPFLDVEYINRTHTILKNAKDTTEVSGKIQKLERTYGKKQIKNAVIIIGDITRPDPSDKNIVSIILHIIDVRQKKVVPIVHADKRIRALMADTIDALHDDTLQAIRGLYPYMTEKPGTGVRNFKDSPFSISLVGGYFYFVGNNGGVDGVGYMGAMASFKILPDWSLSLASDYAWTEITEDNTETNSVRVIDAMLKLNYIHTKSNHSFMYTFMLGMFSVHFLETGSPGVLPASGDKYDKSDYTPEFGVMLSYYYHFRYVDLFIGAGYKHVVFTKSDDLNIIVAQMGLSYNF